MQCRVVQYSEEQCSLICCSATDCPLSAPDVICEAVLVIASLSVPFVSAHVSTAVRGAQCVDTNIYEKLDKYSIHWKKTSAQRVFISDKFFL